MAWSSSGKARVCVPSGHLPQGDKTLIRDMFYVYVILSQMNGYICVGSTEHVEHRLQSHNAGKVRSTKAYRPWTLQEVITCDSRAEAVRREYFLKTGQQKELLRAKYCKTSAT